MQPRKKELLETAKGAASGGPADGKASGWDYMRALRPLVRLCRWDAANNIFPTTMADRLSTATRVVGRHCDALHDASPVQSGQRSAHARREFERPSNGMRPFMHWDMQEAPL